MRITGGLWWLVVCLAAGLVIVAAATAGEDERVVVTYYHGTIRCFECLEIERFSRQTVEERFGERMAAGKLEWRTVDYDRPENAAAIERYDLPCPSLVISRFRDSREVAWRVAGETWKKIAVSSEELMDYVEREVGESISGGPPGPG